MVDDLGPDGPAAEPTVWKIAIRDDIRATMATLPTPDWAKDEAERDWYLEHMLHGRPREDYTVEEVPGPVERAIHDEEVRFRRVRQELWEKRKRGGT